MRLKYLFIILNGVLLFFILLPMVVSWLFLGIDFTLSFLQNSWPFLLFLLLFLAGMDVLFVINQKLLVLLQKKDWPALAVYLEDRIFRAGHYRAFLVRLLANTYLSLADVQAVGNLEKKIWDRKPGLVEKNILIFGAARILSKTAGYPETLRFFSARLDTAAPAVRSWVHWYYGLTLMLNGDLAAADVFISLTNQQVDLFITALSAYFLSETLGQSLPEKREALDEAIRRGREKVRKSLPLFQAWEKKLKKSSGEVHIAVLMKYLEKAGGWIYR